MAQIVITWEHTKDFDFENYEVWCHTSDISNPNSPPENVTETATLVGEPPEKRFIDTNLDEGAVRYYWVRAKDINDNYSQFAVIGSGTATNQGAFDNINISGNTISSINTDGNINLDPDGNGVVNVQSELDIDGNLNHDGSQAGFFGTAEVSQQGPLTAKDTGTVNSGDAATDSVIENNRTRIEEIENALKNYGLLS